MFSGTQRACCGWTLIRDNNGHTSSKTVTKTSFPYTPILLSSKNPHAILARASTSSCTTPAGQFVCFCTRAETEPRCPKLSSQPTSHAPTFKLAVGQAFKNGITGNLFFTVWSDFFFFFFAWVFESLNINFSSYLLLPCCYAGPGQAPSKVFLSAPFRDRNHWSP